MGATDIGRVRHLYELFASACQQAGWEAYLPHRNTDPELTTELADTAVLEKDLEQIRRADVIIAYLGEPSLGVGAELAIAMQQEKMIVALYESSKTVSRFVLGLLRKYPNASVFAYASLEEASQRIRDVLANKVKSENVDCGITKVYTQTSA